MNELEMVDEGYWDVGYLSEVGDVIILDIAPCNVVTLTTNEIKAMYESLGGE